MLNGNSKGLVLRAIGWYYGNNFFFKEKKLAIVEDIFVEPDKSGGGNYNVIISPNFYEVDQTNIINIDTIPAYIAMNVLSCAFYSKYFGRISINDCMESDNGKLNTIKNKHLSGNQLSKLTRIEDEFYKKLKDGKVLDRINSIDLDGLLLNDTIKSENKKLDLEKLDKELNSNHYDILKAYYSEFIDQIREALDTY